jgi:folate-binding protein YgfZ
MTDSGYNALREGAAWLDLAGRGVIEVTGDDRARLLHAMSTNHVLRMQPGDAEYAFFLNPQGRMLADAYILCEPERFVLDTEPETRQLLIDHLDHFIIADDVTIEDKSSETAVIAVEGPKAGGVVEAAGLARVWAVSATGAEARRLYVPAGEKALVIAKLEAAGASAATAEDAKAVRLEHAKPRYGEDLSAEHIAHEARLLGAVHFSKGCYIGQEIVERVRSRGRPNRLLTLFQVDGADVLAPGAKVTAGDAEVGAITSSAFSPAEGTTLALAYVRSDSAQPGATVVIDGRKAKATDRLKEHAAA